MSLSLTLSLNLSLVLTGLTACSRPASDASGTIAASAASASTASKAGPASAEAQLAQELMQAVFGKQYRSASHDSVAELPDIKQRKQRSPHLIAAAAQHRLDDGRMVLVTNAQLLDQSGSPIDSHASSGLLGVYILQNSGGKWQVLKKHENVAELGSQGTFGEVDFVSLASGHPGIVVHSGGTWQGYTVEEISLFDLAAETLHDLSGDPVLLHSDSEGGCGPETAECWNIRGKYRFVPGQTGVPYQDLLIDFTGEKSVLANTGEASATGAQGSAQAGTQAGASAIASASPVADDPERKVSKISTRARYAWDGKQYRLVEGENPVPRP